MAKKPTKKQLDAKLEKELDKLREERNKTEKPLNEQYDKVMKEAHDLPKDTSYEEFHKVLKKADPERKALDEIAYKNMGKVFSAKTSINVQKKPVQTAEHLAECLCNKGMFPEEPISEEDARLCKQGVKEYFEEKKKRK